MACSFWYVCGKDKRFIELRESWSQGSSLTFISMLVRWSKTEGPSLDFVFWRNATASAVVSAIFLSGSEDELAVMK